MARKTSTETLQRNRRLLAAFAKHFAPTDVLAVGGVKWKVGDLVQLLQDHAEAHAIAEGLLAKWRTAVRATHARGAKVTEVLPNLRLALIHAFGGGSQLVADFDFTPKRRKTTVGAQSAAKAKRAATRKARGTLGKKQKAKIKGAGA